MNDGMYGNIQYKRGQVWYVNSNGAIGGEESVGRTAVIISTDASIDHCKTCVVAYTTTTPKNGFLTPEINSTKYRSWVLCRQVATVDKSRLLSYMCTLTDAELNRVELGLRKSFGLPIKVEGAFEDIYEEEGVPEKKDLTVEFERDTYKKLYEKALDELVALKMNKDFVTKATILEVPKVVVENPEPVEALDLSGLQKVANVRKAPVKKVLSNGKININTATAEEISGATGLGLVTARDIVAYRNRHGKYKNLTDLKKIGRFGVRSYNKYTPMMEV